MPQKVCGNQGFFWTLIEFGCDSKNYIKNPSLSTDFTAHPKAAAHIFSHLPESHETRGNKGAIGTRPSFHQLKRSMIYQCIGGRIEDLPYPIDFPFQPGMERPPIKPEQGSVQFLESTTKVLFVFS